MEQQQNSKNQQGQQNKMPPTGNATQDVAVGATQGMPKTFQNEKSTQSPSQQSSQGQSQFGKAGQENEQADKNNSGFPPDLQMNSQMNKQMNQHDKSTEVSESQQNPNEQGSSNKGSVNMGQQLSGGQSQQTPSQNK